MGPPRVVEGEWLVLVLAIVERSTGRVIGEVDLKHASADAGEVGYVIAADRQGHGFANEALTELIRFAFDDLSFEALTASISPGNEASVALVRKHGFQRNAARDSHDGTNPTRCFELRRSGVR
ncbi:GNAT family N-acetyltransferase [Rhodococcus pyridinivorans]|uniref:GNAT family N-acetyltransferase n=1 Tax=Rhodococcus pyridinivorans TaxID=103816 RepID=UPI002078A4EE|nr:GNAT family protein [Rhodococcus pyridinivorans]USI88394.1 GNAT family N-acetyltransferase [Rhodococcus pyridinivorans]